MKKPIKVTDVDMAFGGKCMDILPEWNSIPDEFKNGRTEWNKIASKWFFSGLPQGTGFIPQDGIDGKDALRNLKCVLMSFEPKHEHKEAGAAYLLSLWFKEVRIPETTAK